MVKGFYDATAGLQARALQQDTISHNLANVSTDGYQAQKLAFRTLLDHQMVVHRPGGSPDKWNEFENGRYDVKTSGAVHVTENPLDFCIEGDGYFALETPAGTAYTRSGNFMLDDEGKLVSSGGYPVRMEGGGELVVPKGAEIVLGKDGTLRIDDSVVGKLDLVRFSADAKLERMGDNLVKPSDEQTIPGGVAVAQGQLEDSNVNAVREMVDMIMTSRMFESISKALTTTDDTMRTAINDVGRTG
ncbi:MAG: flagellar hook-basal body protein [bacterium]|nr:flagellar hook-basal body protein [bacterium]